MASIVSTVGLGSGLDLGELVSGLVKAEEEPKVARYQEQQADLISTLSGVGSLKGSLSDFQSSLEKLADVTKFQQRSVTSSKEETLTVTAGTNAVEGSYSVEVQQLAKVSKVATKAFDATNDFPGSSNPATENLLTTGSSTLTIGQGASSFNITVDASKSSLNDIADAINDASDNVGVTATLVSGSDGVSLVLTGKTTGAVNDVSLSVSGAGYGEKLQDLNTNSVVSGGFASGAAFTNEAFKVSVAGTTYDITTAFDEAPDGTLDINDIAAAITRDTSGAVTATVENDGSGNDRLVLTSSNGLDINIDTTGVVDANLASLSTGNDAPKELQAAQDSIIKVDDFFTIQRTSNTVSDAISGVSLELKAADVGNPVTVGISLDKQSVKDTINEFVDAYNSLNSLIADLGQVADEDAGIEAGALQGESILRTVSSQVRDKLLSSVGEGDPSFTGAFSSLAEIGIVLDGTKKDGSLTVDTKTLDDALASNFDDIGEVFASDSGGIAKSLDTLIEDYVKSNGTLDLQTDSLNDSISRIKKEQLEFVERMDRYEARLMSQFIAMEKQVLALNNTGSYLTQQLDNLPGFVKKD